MGKIAFTELKFAADTCPLIRWELTITAEDRHVVCESKTKRIKHQCTEEEWRKLEKLFSVCNFQAWQDKYYKPTLDGTNWCLEIHGSDGQVKKSDGMNGYPEEWEAFMELCDYCAEIAGFETDEER